MWDPAETDSRPGPARWRPTGSCGVLQRQTADLVQPGGDPQEAVVFCRGRQQTWPCQVEVQRKLWCSAETADLAQSGGDPQEAVVFCRDSTANYGLHPAYRIVQLAWPGTQKKETATTRRKL